MNMAEAKRKDDINGGSMVYANTVSLPTVMPECSICAMYIELQAQATSISDMMIFTYRGGDGNSESNHSPSSAEESAEKPITEKKPGHP